MTIPNFKLAPPSASRASTYPNSRPQRPAGSHSVPVKELAAPVLPPIDRDDVTEAAEISRLLSMPFPAFTQTVSGLLESLGYASVEAMKPMHGRGKGRNAHGGYDLRMYLPTRLTCGLVIAQVKQYRETVPRSFVDELRGTMLRLGASQGLLVTTGAFSASAIEAAQAAQYAAPVRLMDGQELARLLHAHPHAVQANTAQTDMGTAITPPHAKNAPASRLRPLSQAEGERLHQEFLDGLGAPPDERARKEETAAWDHENVRLDLRVTLHVVPDATHNGHAGLAGERRQA